MAPVSKFGLTRTTRLSIVIGISSAFFLVEVIVGFKTHSIALIADAFHYLNDLVSLIVALTAVVISKDRGGHDNKHLSFGWQRAQLLGSFFNGVFLLALGVSIVLQSIERFIALQPISNPLLVIVVGCVGLTLNLVCAVVLHEHDHGGSGEHPLDDLVVDEEAAIIGTDLPLPPISVHHEHRHKVDSTKLSQHSHHDLGMAAVLLHVLSDAINNLGVILAGTVIWKVDSPARYYADPSISLFIAAIILASAAPLIYRTGKILLQSPPAGVDVADIRHDLEQIPGVLSIHELHVWRLNQHKAVATAHVVVADPDLARFEQMARTIMECLHAYGVHSATMQPELAVAGFESLESLAEDGGGEGIRKRVNPQCSLNCGSSCTLLSCCG